MAISDANIAQEIMKTQNKQETKKTYKDSLQDLSAFGRKIFLLIKNNKEKVKILIPIAIISVLLMVYMITKTIIHVQELNKQSSQLYNLNYFNTKNLEKNNYTKEDIKWIKTINELISYEIEIGKEINRYNEYLENLQNPYNNLMKHLLLPQLNLWKDPFMWDIDISILGAKFLEKNPYDDIKLIQKWSNFFKNVWSNNEFNEIEDIVIWDMVEEENLFYIPINIKFIANSKRSFLLLIEKLSLTSNEKNISLINEFMYHLRENIKTNKQEQIKKLSTTNSLIASNNWDNKENIKNIFNENQLIGYHIYQWIFNDKDNILIDDTLINQTIKDTIMCDDESDTYCYYKFRDKYRSIPSLAYTIWLEKNNNKTKNFKKFLQDLPPIININKFTFDRNMEQNLSNYENIQYKGEIQMDIYWKSISNQEVEEIALLLGEKCLDTKLTTKQALNKIDNTLINIGSIAQINTTNTANLRELQAIIQKIDKTYWELSNYKKIIKLFELYRMLKDWDLCQ